MAKHQFQTEVNQLLNLMIHSLYSNKEIFLRELVSNSSDALDKLKFLTLTDENLKSLNFEPKIEIFFNKDAKTLILKDNGIGMNEDDLIEHLGTIAKSGTKSFVEALSKDNKKDSNLIGQFGVGFYATFMVSDNVEVISKKAGEEKAYKWVSTGTGEYEITETERDEQGTTIVIHIKDESEEYLSEHRIENIVKKYSDHIAFPIMLEKDKTKEVEVEAEEGDSEVVKEGEEPKEKKTKTVNYTEIEQINNAKALWTKSKSDITNEEYNDFYKTIGHDSEDPILSIHTKAEGVLEYTTLFYVPSKAPFDLYRVDYQSSMKLYIKKVFITDDDKELMPQYLRFVKGLIDSEDLPLNVSREILQQNPILTKIKSASTKKVLTELGKMLKKDKEKYVTFFNQFGRCIKEGLYSDFENKEKLLDLLVFKSTKRDGLISLKEYVANMGEEQKDIFYIIGRNENVLKNSPLLESFKEKDIEVLILDDEIDEIVFPNVTQYKNSDKEFNLKSVADEVSEDKVNEDTETEFKAMLEKAKELLKSDVKDVKLTTRLKDSPACVVLDKNDPSFAMQQMMQQMGGNMAGGMDMPEVLPVLELNPNNEIVQKLVKVEDDNLFEEIIKVLADQSKLIAGFEIKDQAGFTTRLTKILGLILK